MSPRQALRYDNFIVGCNVVIQIDEYTFIINNFFILR